MVKEVFPKKIDIKAAQFEFQRLIDAFLGVAEAELSATKERQSAPTHNGDADKRFDTPLSLTVSINGNPR